MNLARETKQNKEQFLREMYTLAEGRFGILIDSYDLGDKYNLGLENLKRSWSTWKRKGSLQRMKVLFMHPLHLKELNTLKAEADNRVFPDVLSTL